MTPEQLHGQLQQIEEENKKLKAARKYRVELMADAVKTIEECRYFIQLDLTISANTDQYMEKAAQLRALLKK